MALDNTVRTEMRDDMSLVERIKMYVPVYRGYREKNLRREEDRAIRNELSRAVQGTKQDLATIQRGLVSQPALMLDVERIRTKVDRYDTDIRKAVNGYSGFHAAVKILEDDLDALIRWDAALMDGIASLRQGASDILATVDSGGDASAILRAFERTVDSMIEDYGRRETVMRGFDKDGGE